jgi:hypothetical protein
MRVFAGSRRTKTVVVLSCLIALPALLGLSALYLRKGRLAPISPAGSVPINVIELWTQVAREESIPENVVQRVAVLMERAYSAEELTPAAGIPPKMRESLRRFLGEFGSTFSHRQYGSDFSRYFVWLVGDALRRAPVSAVTRDMVRRDFQRGTDMLAARLRADFQQRLGADFAKQEKRIEQGIAWTTGDLLRRFDDLQADPLFPCFKERLNDNVLRVAVQCAAVQKDYDWVCQREPRKMVLEEEGFVGRLEAFFEDRPRCFFFGLVRTDLDEVLRFNRYWGIVDHTIVSTHPGQVWPMQIMLHVADKTEGAAPPRNPLGTEATE